MFEMGKYDCMAGLWLLIIVVMSLGNADMAVGKDKEVLALGKWTKARIDGVLRESSGLKDPGERIGYLSEKFLDTAYREHTLVGDMETPEVLVVNLKEVDCFTFIDYVEAMRLSGSFEEFKENLKKVRYRAGDISFENRNHFFSDWREFNAGSVGDVTGQTGAGAAKKINKMLNRKRGGVILSGIGNKQREIVYVPSGAVDAAVLGRLRTGDYVGIYTRKQGLDVSHVGIIIKKDDTVYFRHASSHPKNRRVVDNDFKKYISDKPGIVVLRPKN